MVRHYLQRSVPFIKNVPFANGGLRFVKGGSLPMVYDTSSRQSGVRGKGIAAAISIGKVAGCGRGPS